MPHWLSYPAIFLCAMLIEVGWILSVRSVTANRAWTVAGNAVLMQGISNVATLILVSDAWTVFASITGAGCGAIVCMKSLPRSL